MCVGGRVCECMCACINPFCNGERVHVNACVHMRSICVSGLSTRVNVCVCALGKCECVGDM